MTKEHFKTLLSRYLNNSITPEECNLLLNYLDANDNQTTAQLIEQVLEYSSTKNTAQQTFTSQQKENVYERITQAINEQGQTNKSITFLGYKHSLWYRVAVILVIVFSVGVLIWKNTESSGQFQESIAKQDIFLSNTNATLFTTPNGKHVLINDSLEGILADFEDIFIEKRADGTIYYEVKNTVKTDQLTIHNTLSTPKGNTAQLLLPDGSKVWLNAESTIRFPSTFTGDSRVVELIGEAYFEVASNPSKPFKVVANEGYITVLGTHFNVSAFKNEDRMITTLLEGSVRVSNTKNTMTLIPGQQASMDTRTADITRTEADLRAVMAWKNGYFRFDNASIEEIMRSISRWYAISEVDYQGPISGRFTGTFQRTKGLSQLFTHLEKISTMQFEIKEGRVLIRQ